MPNNPDDSADIPDALREELDRRLDAADADPTGGIPWEEVRARLWSGLRTSRPRLPESE